MIAEGGRQPGAASAAPFFAPVIRLTDLIHKEAASSSASPHTGAHTTDGRKPLIRGGRRGPDALPRRLWTADEDERLRAMMAEKMARKDIAAALNRTENSIQDRCTKFGLKFDAAASRARAVASMSKVYSDPAYRKKLAKAISKAWSPERRAAMSEQASERRFWEAGHAALAADPEARERQRRRAAKAGREYGEARMAWCPPHLRDEYRRLTRHKNLTAAEARAAIKPQIAAFLQTFEGQLWRVRTGKARIVEVAPIATQFDRSLTGSSLNF